MELDQIVAKLNIISFLEAQGIVFEKKTKKGWYAETCPFCEGKQKIRFNVSDSDKKGLWKCFKCEESGNVITFYAKLHNCSNGDAVKAIKKFAGIEDDDYRRKVEPVSPKANHSNIPANLSAGDGDPGLQGPSEDAADDGQAEKGEVYKGKTENGQEVEIGKPGNNQAENTDQQAGSTARGAARPRDIYSTLVRDSALTDAHRQELRSRRGFANALIDRLAFRSGGEYMKAIIENMRETFSDQDLQEAGILVEVNGVMAYNNQLLEEHILIPYIDENDEAYHLRPHKLGFKDIAPKIYCRYLLKDRPAEVILAESEFKAAALMQWGISSIGIPGVGIFGKRYFSRIVELLKEFEIKKVYVIFDNEIKNDPELPNFKQKPESRYDTELWSYLMAYKLSKEGFATKIGKLPDEWRENGKIDFDGALAQGHTREEILKVIDAAVSHKEYLENLPEEARRIVRRKISRHFSVVPVEREFNKYVAIRSAGKGNNRETWKDTISNFVLDIKSSFFTPEGVIRNVQLVNEYGETSETFPLTPGEMAGLNEWKKFCFGKGNFVFEGNTQDLLNVWKREFLRDTGDLIYMPDRIGYIEDSKLWLFGNMAIKDGQVYRPDNDGIIWIDGRGYKPQSLQLGARGEAIEDAIPSLSEKTVDMGEIAQRMKQTVGGYEAYMGIGWVIATIFSYDIFREYKCMPILFSHGKRESGKSTILRWLMNFFGIETEGIGIAETTQNFIARALSYYSSLGCWFDEYRNDVKVTQKDGFFRSAYNRQFSGKGTATAFQARGFAVHATVTISGEELPKDNGLFTRLIPIQASAYKRDRTWFEWFNRHCSEFSYLTYYLLLNYEKLKPEILKNIAEMKKALLKQDISDRTAENWAICAGAFEAIVFDDDAFIKWVEETCQEIKRTGESEHMLNLFWNDVSYLISEGKLGFNQFVVNGDELSVWFSGAYEVWALHYRSKTGKEPFAEHSIRKYLQDEEYYLYPTKEQSSYRVYFGKGNSQVRKRAITISISKAPEVLEEVVDILLTIDNRK